MNYNIIIIFFFLLAVCYGKNERAWEQTGDYLGEMQYVLHRADQSLVTLGSDSDGKLVFSKISKDGAIQIKKRIIAPAEFSFDGTLAAPAIDANNRVYQLVKSPEKSLLLACLDMSGKIVGMVDLGENYAEAKRCWVSSLHVLNERLYLVGAKKRQLWIASVGLEDMACLRLESSFTLGPNDMATDIKISSKGTLLIALHTGYFGRYGEGKGEVGLVEFLPEQSACMLRYKAKGRTPSLCQTRKGFAFAFDTKTTALDQQIVVHELDKHFHLQHHSIISETQARTSLPKLSQSPNGDASLIVMEHEQPQLVSIRKGEVEQQGFPGDLPGMAIHAWTGTHLLYRVRKNPFAKSPRNVFKEQLVALQF